VEHRADVRLNIQNVSKTFHDRKKGPFKAVDNVSFDVYDGEFLVLLGPGRCGKSVLLNIITGLLPADSGVVRLDGKPINGPNPEMGMVFQKLGLMPWLTVIENVEFGPKMRDVPTAERREKANHFIRMVGLDGFENSYPYQLSGGMKQRVGIARAYANDVKVLVMDEPFGQLDAQTRYQMQKEIIDVAQKDGRTIIFVTNNIEEAVKVGDRIILLTACPARVKVAYEIKLPKPRDEISEAFLSIRREVSDNTDLAL
jgi:ABC-type nitrate/sulfonate/bicarbonate transport system ATPase subunit